MSEQEDITMKKLGRISRIMMIFIPLFMVVVLLFPTGFTVSQIPEQDSHQVYLPLVPLAPQDIYSQFLNGLGGWDNLFYVEGQLAFLGRGHQLVILDVSAPNNPKFLTEIQLPAVPTYLTVKDGYGYLALGYGGFAVLDLRQPAQAYLLGRLPLDGFSRHVFLSDNVAFVSNDQALYVLDISQPAYPRQLSSIPMSANYSQLHDSLLLVVYDAGFAFFDISDLSALVKVGNYGNGQPPYPLLSVGADHAYMLGIGCGMHGCDYSIDIVDISDPSQPTYTNFFDVGSIPTMLIDGEIAYISDYTSIIVARINPDGTLEKLMDYPTEFYGSILALDNNKIYFGGEISFEILDVTDSLDIRLLGKYTSSSYAFESSQISLPFIYYRASLIGAEEDESHLLAFDVSAPEEPALVSEMPFSSLNIQTGFYSDQIYLDGNRMYMTAPMGQYSGWPPFQIEGIKIFDLQQPSLPVELAEYVPGTPEQGVGIWFENLQDSVQIKDSIGYIMTMGKNLEIVDLSSPTAPLVLSSYPANARMVRLEGSHAYLTSEVNEDPNTSLHLLTLDVTDPRNPALQSDIVITTSWNSNYLPSFDVSDGIAYLALPGVLRLIDVSVPTNPSNLSALPIDSEFAPTNTEVEGDLALYTVENALEIIDVSMPLTPTRLSAFDAGGSMSSIQILDDYVYLSSKIGAYVLDVKHPDQPRVLQYYPGYATSMQSKLGYPVYIARVRDGLEIYKPYPSAIPLE